MIKKELIKYCNDVLDDKVIACQKHKWSCQRFLYDLERDFEYEFNEEKAERYLRFMSFFKHKKGVLAGKNIKPVDIQKFVYGNIYGWVHKETGYRRFKKAYWQVGRKNAKSQGLAIIGLYDMAALGEQAAEILCAATKKEQAKIVWDEANWLWQNCEGTKEKFNTAYHIIKHLKTDSTFKAMSKDDRMSGDGYHPSTGIIDEYHAHQTSEYYDILTSGMAGRKNPLMFIITTAGFELNNPCYRIEYKYISEILNPNIPVNNDNYFVMVNELDKDDDGNLIDDIKDESVWAKANPIVCSYELGIEYLRGELKLALDNPEKMRNFLTKNMNVWVNQREHGYMNMEKWNSCKGEFEMFGCSTTLGVDLSSAIDLTSATFEINVDDEKIGILSHSFMPSEKVAEREKKDMMPYTLWAEQGYLTITDGAEVNYDAVIDYIVKTSEENNFEVMALGYDKWNATKFAQTMSDDFGFNCVDVIQGIKTLSEPTKDFRVKVYRKEIIHLANPLYDWTMANTIQRIDHNENIMLDKAKSRQRIDPVASTMTAHVVMIGSEKSISIYEKRGMRKL